MSCSSIAGPLSQSTGQAPPLIQTPTSSDLLRRVQSLEALVPKFQAQIGEQTQKIEGLEKTVKELGEDNKELHRDISTLQENGAQRASECAELAAKVECQNKRLERGTAHCSRVVASLTEGLVILHVVSKKDVERLETRVATLEEEVTGLQARMGEMAQLVSDLFTLQQGLEQWQAFKNSFSYLKIVRYLRIFPPLFTVAPEVASQMARNQTTLFRVISLIATVQEILGPYTERRADAEIKRCQEGLTSVLARIQALGSGG